MSIRLAYRRYEDYMSTAKKHLEKKDIDNAMKFFLLASKEMLEIAKLSSPTDRKKHEAQANKILEIIKELAIQKKKQEKAPKPTPKVEDKKETTPPKPTKPEIKEEKKEWIPKKKEKPVLSVVNYTDQIKLVKGKDPEILIQLSDSTIKDQVYLKWNNKYLLFTKELSDWSVFVKDITTPGTMKFDVLHKDKTIGTLQITFSKGYIENDLGL